MSDHCEPEAQDLKCHCHFCLLLDLYDVSKKGFPYMV